MKNLIFLIIMMLCIKVTAMDSEKIFSTILVSNEKDKFYLAPEVANQSALLKSCNDFKIHKMHVSFDADTMQTVCDILAMKSNPNMNWKQDVEIYFNSIIKNPSSFAKLLLALNYFQCQEIIELLSNFFLESQNIKNKDDIFKYFNNTRDLREFLKKQLSQMIFNYYKPEVVNQIKGSKKRKIEDLLENQQFEMDLSNLRAECPYGNFEINQDFLWKKLCDAYETKNIAFVETIIKYFPPKLLMPESKKRKLKSDQTNTHEVNLNNLPAEFPGEYGNFDIDQNFLLQAVCDAYRKKNMDLVETIVKYFPLKSPMK